MTKFFARAARSPHFFALIRVARRDRCARDGRKFHAEIAVFRRKAPRRWRASARSVRLLAADPNTPLPARRVAMAAFAASETRRTARAIFSFALCRLALHLAPSAPREGQDIR
jgi:hypothetical protein